MVSPANKGRASGCIQAGCPPCVAFVLPSASLSANPPNSLFPSLATMEYSKNILSSGPLEYDAAAGKTAGRLSPMCQQRNRQNNIPLVNHKNKPLTVTVFKCFLCHYDIRQPPVLNESMCRTGCLSCMREPEISGIERKSRHFRSPVIYCKKGHFHGKISAFCHKKC